ncbi:CAP domain-containing protein [Tautonia rosea]|uniref:CAP domain-containing protein n=1 Tax=Tautonia rosea TaxID=2728037 RepID=UPI001473445C|nr:CAP domain-containing protein [Tautonia rosea]
MIKTTWTLAAALILTLAPAIPTEALATERCDASVPLRDDALGFAVLEILPDHTPWTEPEPEPEPEASLPAADQGYGDPYGFSAIINNYRASAGLPPLSYDPNLSAWASQNNAAQCSRGLGHHIMANFFQNCGYNQTSVFDIAISWMNSPGHAQNMLAPSATRFGIAYGPGPYWTMNLQ